jgi:hypothetical protein
MVIRTGGLTATSTTRCAPATTNPRNGRVARPVERTIGAKERLGAPRQALDRGIVLGARAQIVPVDRQPDALLAIKEPHDDLRRLAGGHGRRSD